MSYDDFDDFATDYEEIHSKGIKISGSTSEYFRRHKIDLLIDREFDQTLDVLDFGCGDGLMTEYLATKKPNWKIYGVDVSSKSIDIAKSHTESIVQYSSFDGHNLTFPHDKFDIVYSSMVFHHIRHKNHRSLFGQINEILKPGGRFYLFEHNPLNPITRKIVRECPFDKDAELLRHAYSKALFTSENFKIQELNFILFLPRHKFFRILYNMESIFKHIPFGAQYVITGIKK